ncbi:MAG: tRNA guanosine(34) transglycosylase Tgt [Defluviitaleaceae bacterium]|nr:tRNA guanosine(34) transglycosylase Tgt [Defluviitaleaceae bacterium]MCL2836926.1 tRNA guanosine(34) transglycosylase Tgt [Defluviitaleaceae bacterium]
MYTITASEGPAKAARLTTPHGIIETPVFMNVGTQAAIKGGVSAVDLLSLKCRVELSNTYHLHVRPGDELIRELGGLHKFMAWDGPILTDSGGFQIFSLSGLRKISEEGVLFASHVDGKRIFMGPEESAQIQSNLGSDIAMAFDECIPAKAGREYVLPSVDRTTRWLLRCMEKLEKLRNKPETLNPGQVLFGINQGGLFRGIRSDHAKRISELELPGYAIGGLAVGESHEEMYDIIETVIPHLPADKPTYLMGVGTPANIIEGVYRGIDFFDCVMPARNGRHGHVYTWEGKMNLLNKKYEKDSRPIEEGCGCPACGKFTRAYLRHLFKAGEMLALRLCVMHNLFFYNSLMEEIRRSIINKTFTSLRLRVLEAYNV